VVVGGITIAHSSFLFVRMPGKFAVSRAIVVDEPACSVSMFSRWQHANVTLLRDAYAAFAAPGPTSPAAGPDVDRSPPMCA
jgi:hypothetical protein